MLQCQFLLDFVVICIYNLYNSTSNLLTFDIDLETKRSLFFIPTAYRFFLPLIVYFIISARAVFNLRRLGETDWSFELISQAFSNVAIILN